VISEAGDATIVTTPLKSSSGNQDHSFRFVTNHAHVLQVISADPTVRLRDIAQRVGITERTAAQIVNDLEQAGYLSKSRDGRRNRYEVHDELPLRHPQHRHHTVGDLIRFLEAPAPGTAPRGSPTTRSRSAVQSRRRREG
jgi:DNA-binding IscR family transcriptional regulator